MKQLFFNGVGSAAMGMTITGSGTFNAPERDLEIVSIPGRNGDLVIDRGRYKNIQVTYPVSICENFAAYAEAARSWLLYPCGYCRLEDDYDPDHFRMALYKGPLSFTPGFLNQTGEASIAFDCKPQRFLKAGEREITLNGAALLRNPTGFPALPLITVYGSGTGQLQVGDYAIQVLKLDGPLTLDSEMEEAYALPLTADTQYRNDCISAPDFPVLGPGTSRISWSGGITKIEIIPRWWTL